MTTKRTRQVLAATVLGAALLLGGCSQSDEKQMTPGPSASTEVEVDDAALAVALDAMMAPGTESEDGGACLVRAVHAADVEPETLAQLIETGGDDFGAAVLSVRNEVGEDAAEPLTERTLQARLDACTDAGVTLPEGAEEATYEAPKTPERTEDAAPNTTPKYPLEENDMIRGPQQLREGVISMFTSYALDDEQVEEYTHGATCISQLIYAEDFSAESLEFIAGGAPLGSGAIVDHLATDEDKKIWSSPRFASAMADCIENGESEEDAAATLEAGG